MSIKHSIKIDDEVYKRLEGYRGKRETFSQAINRLLLLRDGIQALTSVLEGQRAYLEYKEGQLKKDTGQAAAGDSQEVPHVLSG